MKLDYLKEKKEWVSVVLLGFSALMAVLVLMKVVGFFVVSARAGNLVEKAIAQSQTDPNDLEKYFAASRALADGLKKDNLWVPPPPRQHPVKEVPAIFGDEVLINDKWYKVGDTVGDAKILAIEATEVRIEWDGSVKAFLPINATIPEPPKGSRASKPGEAETVVAGGGRGPTGDRDDRRGPGGAFGGRPGMPGFGARPGMPGFGSRPGTGGFSGDRDAIRERFANMSEAERDRFRAEMRERMARFGGGGTPGGGFRGDSGGRSRGPGGGSGRGPGGRR